MSSIAIKNVRIFDGYNTSNDLSSVSFNTSTGLITTEANSDSFIDGAGCTVLPGLWDTHAHISSPGPRNLELSVGFCKDMAKCGITTAVDCGKMSSDHHKQLQEEDAAPDIFYTGNFATSTGSIHSKFSMNDDDSIVDTVEAAVAFVENRAKQGAHYIKIVADVPGPSQEIVNQLSKSAKEHGKLTIVHAACHAAFLMALNAEPPVTIITHAPTDKALSADEARLMKEKGIVSVATLIMMKTMATSGKFPTILFPPAIESVKAMRAAGVPMLVGTDSNISPIANVVHGISVWQEMELLQEAGMSPLEILRGATQLSSQSLKIEDRGSIAEGKRADLLLVEGDPTTDIQALKRVVRVWKAGKDIYNRDG